MATFEVEVDGYVEEMVEQGVGGIYTVDAADEDEAREKAEQEFGEEFGFDSYADYVNVYEMEEE